MPTPVSLSLTQWASLLAGARGARAGGLCQEGRLGLPRLRAPRPAMNAGIAGLINPGGGQQARYSSASDKYENEALFKLAR